MQNYFNPVKIIYTSNWLLELTENCKHLNISSPIIISTPGNRRRLKLDQLFDDNSIFSNFSNNPNFEDCKHAINFCLKNTFNGVIAIGGGSAMDLAKVIMAHLCLKKTNIYELINYKDPFPDSISSIFLPTTHGTGSEVTMWGTVWNMEERKKYSISHQSLYPNITILDGNLTMSLPLDISIITVMDALSHSLESIWNKNANDTSTNHAINAICKILKNVDKLKENPKNLEIRNNLLKASTMAGLAFSNTTTAAAHSISYPMTINFSIPHGIASSISLLPLLEINSEYINKPINRICERMELSYSQLRKLIRRIPDGVLAFRLSEWGIKENQLYKIADESFTKGRMENNIVDLSSRDVLGILKKIF